MKRIVLWIAGVGMLTVVLVVGLTQAGGKQEPAGERFDLEAAKRGLAGAPAPLARLHAQSNELLEGGERAFAKRLAELEGHPVVINKWASWCGPCVAEFPIFQDVAARRGREVAFVGVNGFDPGTTARRFLDAHPVPYPSYVDPDEKIATSIQAPKNYPITVFVTPEGETTIHQGPYESAAELEADIDRYAA